MSLGFAGGFELGVDEGLPLDVADGSDLGVRVDLLLGVPDGVELCLGLMVVWSGKRAGCFALMARWVADGLLLGKFDGLEVLKFDLCWAAKFFYGFHGT